IRLVSRQADHAAGQVHHLNRLTHVENEDFAALAHDRRLQHQLHRLGDGHEVTGDVAVRDCHRAAFANLLFEDRDHAAVAAQHIAETHRHETSTALMVKSENNHFRQPLGYAHHVGGLYGFVGRDHDKIFCAILLSHQGYVIGAEDIVGDRLEAIALHHGNVFVGSGVEHRVWPMQSEHVLKQFDIKNVAD